MNRTRKNESRGGARLIVKTLSNATDFIASTARYTSANTEFCVMFALVVLYVAHCVGGALK